MKISRTAGPLLLFLGISLGLFAQGKQGEIDYQTAHALFGEQRLLTYQKFSLQLTDDGEKGLRELVQLLNQYPQIMKRTFIVVQVFSCEQELNVKPYLGVVRAKQIVDVLEEKIGLPRKKCLIQDTGANPYDKDCLAGSGITLFLKPDWRTDD